MQRRSASDGCPALKAPGLQSQVSSKLALTPLPESLLLVRLSWSVWDSCEVSREYVKSLDLRSSRQAGQESRRKERIGWRSSNQRGRMYNVPMGHCRNEERGL